MPLPVISNTVRAAVSGLQGNGKPWTNVWHIQWTGAGSPSPTNITTMDGIFDDFYAGPAAGGGNYWCSRMCLGGSLQQIVYTLLDGTSPSITVSHVLAATGGAGCAPGEVAAVLTLRSATRGRSYRGRVYLPGVDKALLNNDGTFTAALVANATLQAAAVNAALVAATWRIVVASYRLQLATPVTQFTMNGQADVQRRRK